MNDDELDEAIKADAEWTTLYKNLFTCPGGDLVLSHMLGQLHFFDEVVTPEEMALKNFATKMLHRLGIFTQEKAVLATQQLLKISGGSTDVGRNPT